MVMASSLDGQLVPEASIGVGAAVDSRGKHRVLAELKRLEQEQRFLQEELEEVEKMGNISTICKELLPCIEAKSDPLLPVLHGVVNPLWDRWFEGAPSSPDCRTEIVDWNRLVCWSISLPPL
ncbi:guanine nucleotide-binding protein subunit gamma 2 isoform X2 [Momordica charantia]|uniref:Guanine nucleotide-binding protein subunit gamma 2 isoform X2 n=1 Tax=Momordica charantia TaxID=3673 RepID=A0A6J1CXQ7_MOMCH|nr:guanine nucleotide-binding protein subunit gamma 2 isoform X2 [Momordica charantia]